MSLLTTSALFVLFSCGQLWPQTVDAWWLFSNDHQASDLSASKAIAKFDMNGVKGHIKFNPKGNATLVEYDLYGLKGNNKLYHVHVSPVPAFNVDQLRGNATALSALCGQSTTGGHLNPHNIKDKVPAKSASFDKYEIGDLSGKHGPFEEVANQPDHYAGSYLDDHLPMIGEHSIVGRSIVIHKNDGARWVCATIEPVH